MHGLSNLMIITFILRFLTTLLQLMYWIFDDNDTSPPVDHEPHFLKIKQATEEAAVSSQVPPFNPKFTPVGHIGKSAFEALRTGSGTLTGRHACLTHSTRLGGLHGRHVSRRPPDGSHVSMSDKHVYLSVTLGSWYIGCLVSI